MSACRHMRLLRLNVSECVCLQTYVSALSVLTKYGTLLLMYIITRVNGVNLSCLSILNVPASTKQDTFPLYSVALMMKKMMNLINFLLRLQQSEQKKYMK